MSSNPIKQFILGTAINITVSINIPVATSAKISIQDSSNNYKITNVNMTNDAEGIYSYIWQSTTSDTEDRYRITIKIVSGDYTSVGETFFETILPENFGNITPQYRT